MNWWPQILTFSLGLASVYFFYEYNFFLAVVLFTWFLSRLFGHSIKKILEGVSHSGSEKKSNVEIELRVNILSILNHESVANLFEKLKDHKKFAGKFRSKHEWVAAMVENYKKKYKNENEFEHKGRKNLWHIFKFNIQNNILWEDGKVNFTDSIEHELLLPYEYKGDKDEDYFWHDIESVLKLRVLMVNGQIRVQIGNFNKETTPEIYKNSSLSAYKNWVTITEFPFMYLSQSVSTHYLNLSAYATESYKNRLIKRDDSKDWLTDWKALNAEIAEYDYLRVAFSNDEPADKRFHEVWNKFLTKAKKPLEAENFVDPYKRDDDDWVPGWMQDNSIHYSNDFLYVGIVEHKELREKRERYYWPDYFEETP